MKKLILFTALALASLQGVVYAQSDEVKAWMKRSNTQRVFSPVGKFNTRFRDFVTLKNAKLIIDATSLRDYDYFKPMDSLLMSFQKDIVFYKDSLSANMAGHVRIDYVINEGSNTRKIRFKKYTPDGDCYATTKGNVTQLKMEQDTVRIIIEKRVEVHKDYYEWYQCQATFIINNYTDVANIIADQPEIRHIIDTLQQTKQARYGPDKFGRHTTYASSVYNPNIKNKSFRLVNGLRESELESYMGASRQDFLTVDFNMGAGLVRNKLAPTLDAGLQIQQSFKKFNLDGFNTYSLFVQPYFLFDKNANGDHIANTNMFVNFSWGTGSEIGDHFGLLSKQNTIGVGYLVLSKGNYFKNNTFKVFYEAKLKSGVTLSPELIITDNFKQIFPGLTLKVF